MSGKVYIVHCVDTEGPLYEDPNVPFERIKQIFGVEIPPTQENLILLQNKKYELDGLEDAVADLVDANKITTLGDWERINKSLETVTSDEFRNRLLDSNGNGWKYSWFCMDHVGFTGKNPRRRDEGHHKIFDRYSIMVNQQQKGDIIGFHYHPVSISGNFNDSGTRFWGSDNLVQIICHKIIDRHWFPSVFRPGFHTERPDSHWFLEQWIPFDYGNQSYSNETLQSDLSGGRFGDWRRAPKEWRPYHPAYEDYQSKGDCKRWITRCLNMYARIRQLEVKDVKEAFDDAKKGNDVILSFTNHDYKQMESEVNRVRQMISDVSKEYKNVSFEYQDALSAMRKCIGLSVVSPDLNISVNENKLIVTCGSEIFGTQPFLAIKLKDGSYHWDNFDSYIKDKVWSYAFDNNTAYLEDIDTIGVAVNGSSGATSVAIYNEGSISYYSCNE